MILSFSTDRSSQMLYTLIRLLRSSLLRDYTDCNSIVIFWTHYFTVKSYCSNLWIIFFVSKLFLFLWQYRNDPKFSDKYAWANSVDPDQTAPDQDLHCLPFHLHLLDSLPKFQDNYIHFLGVRIQATLFISKSRGPDKIL